MKGVQVFRNTNLWSVLLPFCSLCTFPAVETTSAQSATSLTELGDSPQSAHRLRLPVAPEELDNAAKGEYIMSHYWDDFDFTDRGWIADTASMEQVFADWAYVLLHLPAAKAAPLARRLMRDASVDDQMLLRFLDLSEHYFDDPNSPYRSEELYIPVLEGALATPRLDEIHKLRPRTQLKTARKNRPGMPAAELTGTTVSGEKVRLRSLNGEHTLLLFYTPGCPECGRVERHIAASGVFTELIQSGGLSVMAVYADEDFAAWRRHLPELPATWTVVCDPEQQINGRETYALRAIPTLYLLDAQKRVVFKDAYVEQIESWLTKHYLLK